ncbi:MAG: hypothetical protein OHK0046_04560 [Anaerolineae bacterium]
MTDDINQNGRNESDDAAKSSFMDELKKVTVDADKGREPKLLTSRMGTRQYSLAALMERIVDAFIDEHGGGSQPLREADTETKRLKLILATADYVIAVESIILTDDEKADILRQVYAELFTYGPLDALFADPTITTITLEGAEKVSVRYGHGELTPLDPLFDDEAHLRKMVKRLLLDSGAELSPETPIIETGLLVERRPVSVNVAGPPVTYTINVDIRVHPAEPPTLDALVQDGYINTTARDVLAALAHSPHGLIIVGETESGKTTLLNALAALLPAAQVVAVERAGELRLNEDALRLRVQWPMEDREGLSFGQQITAALAADRTVMLLDEVRADEAPAIGTLLAEAAVPRQLWTFRGPADAKRLTSALGMLARRSTFVEDGEARVRQLYHRLPFVLTLRRRKDMLQLYSISEWQFAPGAAYPTLTELLVMGAEGLEVIGQKPTLTLDLPAEFWG